MYVKTCVIWSYLNICQKHTGYTIHRFRFMCLWVKGFGINLKIVF